MEIFSQLRRRSEAGFTSTVQGLFYVVLLWWCFGLVFDLGGAAFLSARLRSAAMAAAQDGAKLLDIHEMYRTNGMQLADSSARSRAQAVFAQRMAGVSAAATVRIESGALRDFVIVDAQAIAPMRVLGALGFPDLTLRAHFAAEAVPGIEDQYQ